MLFPVLTQRRLFAFFVFVSCCAVGCGYGFFPPLRRQRADLPLTQVLLGTSRLQELFQAARTIVSDPGPSAASGLLSVLA